MRRAIALMALALPAFGADLKIDHVTLAGSHLDEMREAFSKSTGISTEYGGRHSNHATEMALASFPDGSYLELMGIQRDADPAAVASHVWSKFLRENGGPCASALRVTDVNAEIQRLSSAGIRVGATRKERTHSPGWHSAIVGDRRRRSGAARFILPLSDSRFYAARESCVPVRETDVDTLQRRRACGDRRPRFRTVDRSLPQGVPTSRTETPARRYIWRRSRVVRGNPGGARGGFGI